MNIPDTPAGHMNGKRGLYSPTGPTRQSPINPVGGGSEVPDALSGSASVAAKTLVCGDAVNR